VLFRVLILLALAVGVVANVHMVRRANRGDREFLQRFMEQPRMSMLYAGGGRLTWVRTLVPVSLLVNWLLVGTAVVVVLEDRTPALLAVVLVAGIVVLGLNFLVVRFTGWPRFQIPAPFRGKSEAELQTWFDADPDAVPWDAIADRLPLDVVDASADWATLLVRGRDWYLAIWAPWRGEVGGRPVGRNDATRDLVQHLGGQQLVAVRALAPPEGIVVVEFTDGRVEVRPAPSETPWRLRLPDRTVTGTFRA
jgi:hypothetical protein